MFKKLKEFRKAYKIAKRLINFKAGDKKEFAMIQMKKGLPLPQKSYKEIKRLLEGEGGEDVPVLFVVGDDFVISTKLVMQYQKLINQLMLDEMGRRDFPHLSDFPQEEAAMHEKQIEKSGMT